MRGRKAREAAPLVYTPQSSPPGDAPKRTRLANGSDVAIHCGALGVEQREHFVMLCLDVRHRLKCQHTIAIGTQTGVEVHPREVWTQAIKDAAAAVIFVHNHPSGDPSPSRQDIELTIRLRQVGALCGIQVLDHVVIGDGSWVSMAERNSYWPDEVPSLAAIAVPMFFVTMS